MLNEIAMACRIFNSLAVGVIAIIVLAHMIGELIYDIAYDWMDWKMAVVYAIAIFGMLVVLLSGILGSGILEAIR